MTDATYVRLTERNDWEGETWHAYLPVADNEDALAALRELIHNAFDDFGFTPSEETFTEDEVNALVRDGTDNITYLAEHAKLAGRLPPVDDLEKLYKGQIRAFLAPTP